MRGCFLSPRYPCSEVTRERKRLCGQEAAHPVVHRFPAATSLSYRPGNLLNEGSCQGGDGGDGNLSAWQKREVCRARKYPRALTTCCELWNFFSIFPISCTTAFHRPSDNSDLPDPGLCALDPVLNQTHRDPNSIVAFLKNLPWPNIPNSSRISRVHSQPGNFS